MFKSPIKDLDVSDWKRPTKRVLRNQLHVNDRKGNFPLCHSVKPVQAGWHTI